MACTTLLVLRGIIYESSAALRSYTVIPLRGHLDRQTVQVELRWACDHMMCLARGQWTGGEGGGSGAARWIYQGTVASAASLDEMCVDGD